MYIWLAHYRGIYLEIFLQLNSLFALLFDINGLTKIIKATRVFIISL